MSSQIRVDISSTAGGNAPGSWGTVPGLSATNITIDGTSSVVLIKGDVVPLAQSDNTAEYRLVVNGSAVGSPVLTCFVDQTNGEGQSVNLIWAVTGLSGGTNSFAMEWQSIAGTQSIDTAIEHTLQVLEIKDGAEIIVDQSSQAAASSPATWGNLFSAGSIAVDGPNSILIMLGMVPETMVGDASADHQMSVDGTREGAIISAWSDATNEGDGCSLVHVATGLSAGNHSFELQWQDRTNGRAADTARLRTFQVIEITSGATLQIDLDAITSWTIPSSFGNDPTLNASYTPGATNNIHLMLAAMTLADGAGTDEAANFRAGIDGINLGAAMRLFTDVSSHSHGHTMMYARSGLSIASHSFQVRGELIQATPSADTGRPRTLFVIEFSQLAQEQEGFRFYNDDGSESTATPIEAQDTNITRGKNVNTRLRILTDNTGDAPAQQAGIEYRKVGDPDTEWRLIP